MIMIIIMHNYNNVNDNHNADLFITRTHNVIMSISVPSLMLGGSYG